jgi:hypothetical protein
MFESNSAKGAHQYLSMKAVVHWERQDATAMVGQWLEKLSKSILIQTGRTLTKTTMQIIVISQLTAQPRQERLLGSGEGLTISCCPQWHIAWIFVRIVW